MKSLIRLALLWAGVVGVGLSATLPARAAEVTFDGGTGYAIGINGLVVDGTAYDVTFIDASYNDTYTSVTPTFLGDSAAADRAANAILEALNAEPTVPEISSSPNEVIWVPFEAVGTDEFRATQTGHDTSSAPWQRFGNFFGSRSIDFEPWYFTRFVEAGTGTPGWTGSGVAQSGPAMSTTVVADGTTGPAIFAYTNNAPGSGGSGASGSWEFSTTAGATETIELGYQYTGFHAFFQVFVNLEAYVFDGVSTTTIPLVSAGPANCCSPPSGGFNYVGEVSLSVNAGDEYGFRFSGSNFDSNSRLSGTLTVGPGQPMGFAKLLQATPIGASTALAILVTGGEPESEIPDIEVLQSTVCVDGMLDSATSFGVLDVPDALSLDENGEAFVLGALSGDPETYVAARLVNQSGGVSASGATTECVVAGPNNDAWTRPEEVELTSSGIGDARTGTVQSYIDTNGKSRWFRFKIQPAAKTKVTLSGVISGSGELTGLPADYDLAVFSDIFQAFSVLADGEDIDGLDRLGAEFAPQAFSPQAFSPQAFSPQAFSPQAFSPQAFSPQAFSPQAFSPQAFSPQAFSPQAFSPQAFSPQAFSPQAFSPQAFSPQAFSVDSYSPQAFSPQAFSSAQTRSLIALSAQAGTTTETVAADTWNNTGYYYVRVSGKNGAADLETPFQLSVEVDAGAFCNGVTDTLGAVSYTGVGSSYESLILWDEIQMSNAGYSDAEILPLRAKLDQLAAAVNGVVVNLGVGYPEVQAFHDQAKGPDGSSCPYAANLTAQEIKRVIDAYRDSNPLQYIVLVGDDRQIPFFRYPDNALLGPEEDFDPPMADGTQSQAALRLNYVLGQDEYGARIVTSLANSNFPVPDLAVGRLVETPFEIINVIDAYLETEDANSDGVPDGVVPTPSKTLVTGYDFLEDTAKAVQFDLEQGTLGGPVAPTNRSLITSAEVSPEEVSETLGDGKSWTANQLRGELDQDADIIFLAGHFSANSALAADYQSTLVVTEVDASPLDLSNVLVYSSGCHSGYNIVNPEAVEGITLQLDWPQVFARKGATLIAGTGYQYGDTDFIEYSERLYVEFTRELRRNFSNVEPDGRKPVAIGQALVRAKQRYLADTPEIIGLHRKSVLISTLFGLPMLSIELPGEPLNVAPPEPIVPVDVPKAVPPEFPTAGEVLGLQVAPLNLVGPLSEPGEPVDLELVPGETAPPGGLPQAVYLVGSDGVLTTPGAPALPLISRNVTADGKSLRGVGFRGGAWSESSVLPLTGAPTTELRGVHGVFDSPVNFPMRLATPNYFGAIAGATGTILHITPAQHRDDPSDPLKSILRQFTTLDFELFYSSYTDSSTVPVEGAPAGEMVTIQPALAAAPSLTGVRAVITDFDGDGEEDDVVFFVRAVGDPTAGIQKVWVTYTEGAEATGTWVSKDLDQDEEDSTLWSIELLDAVDDFELFNYMVQAVNGVGLVTLEDNYGAYYTIAGRLGEVGEDGVSDTLVDSATELTTPVAGDSGSYLGQVTATARVTSEGIGVVGASVVFSLGTEQASAITDSGGYATVLDLPLNSLPGTYNLTASYAGDAAANLKASSDGAAFTILKAQTRLQLLFGEQQVNVDNVSSGVTALLTDVEGGPLPEQTVYFTIFGGPDGDITLPVITDKSGVASLGNVMLPPADYLVEAQFLGELPTGTIVEDQVYLESSASGTLDLIGGQNCPSAPVKGKVALTGFCYLVHLIDGKVSMTNGTLIVGSTTLIADGEVDETVGVVDQKIDQYGAGSVLIFESASVRGKISEQGTGGIVVYGTVGGNLFEAGAGGVEVMAPALVEGIVVESGDGDVIIGGTVQGAGDSIANLPEDDALITINATVLGNVSEADAGNLVVTPVGYVDGNASESGEGEAIVNSDSISGKVSQD